MGMISERGRKRIGGEEATHVAVKSHGAWELAGRSEQNHNKALGGIWKYLNRKNGRETDL